LSTLLFATTNAGKLRELEGLLEGRLQLKSLRDFPQLPEVVEDGATFEENARKKALAAAQGASLPALADDSGLCVDALGGRPGVHSARYAQGDDSARVDKLMRELSLVPEDRRGARFECALCLAFPDGRTFVEVGRCQGRIAAAPRGSHGFGYDPVFLLADGRTMAELTRDEKAKVSHRGLAFERMLPRLMSLPIR
jgi:XTP/dITP diphosphohydrolase